MECDRPGSNGLGSPFRAHVMIGHSTWTGASALELLKASPPNRIKPILSVQRNHRVPAGKGFPLPTNKNVLYHMATMIPSKYRGLQEGPIQYPTLRPRAIHRRILTY